MEIFMDLWIYIYMVDISFIYIYVDVVNGVNINQQTLHNGGTTLCRNDLQQLTIWGPGDGVYHP
jgi:hypothetical protein